MIFTDCVINTTWFVVSEIKIKNNVASTPPTGFLIVMSTERQNSRYNFGLLLCNNKFVAKGIFICMHPTHSKVLS